jgi:hypothetical protein
MSLSSIPSRAVWIEAVLTCLRKLPASTDGRGGVEHRLVEVELDVDRASNKPLVHGFPLCGGFVDRRVGEGNNDWKPSAPPNPSY